MELTADQQNANEEISYWLHRGESLAMTLGGPAGTGKTTLMRSIIANNSSVNFAITAPTNKATKVLRESLPEHLGEHCFTIHKANRLMLMNDDEQKYLTRGGGSSAFRDYDCVILDEASMVGSKMFDMVMQEAEMWNKKVLFVGDPYQLKPVRDGNHCAFDKELVPDQILLSKIVRQAEGNPIIEQGQLFRRLIDGSNERARFLTEEGDAIQFLPHDEFDERFIEACKNEAVSGDNRAVAWQNRAVNALAQKVRRELYGEKAREGLVVGERVFTAAPLANGGTPDGTGLAGMYTDQEAEVIEVGRVTKHPVFPDFTVLPVFLSTGVVGYQITRKDEKAFHNECQRLKAIADAEKRNGGYMAGRMYKEWHEFKDAFADLRSVHSITAHRSQGSTFDSVFVDLRDIRGNRNTDDRYRLLYVAVTRARNHVYLRAG